MAMGYLIWQAMSMNGAVIGMAIVTMKYLLLSLKDQKDPLKVFTEFSVEAVGKVYKGICVVPIAIATILEL